MYINEKQQLPDGTLSKSNCMISRQSTMFLANSLVKIISDIIFLLVSVGRFKLWHRMSTTFGGQT